MKESGWWPKKENSVFGYLLHLSHCNVESDKPDQEMAVLCAVEDISLCFKWEWVPHLWSVHSRSCRWALSHHPFIFVYIYLARKHNQYASQRRPTFSIFILSLASDKLSEIHVLLLMRNWILQEGICWKIDETTVFVLKGCPSSNTSSCHLPLGSDESTHHWLRIHKNVHYPKEHFLFDL